MPEYHDSDSVEVEIARGQRGARREATSEAPLGRSQSEDKSGPVDLDELFHNYNSGIDLDDDSIFEDSDDEASTSEDAALLDHDTPKYFNNPNARLLDSDASLIPGSPFSKPSNRASNRPKEPLALAKYASSFSFILTLLWVASLLFMAVWNYDDIGRVVVECMLAILSFLGLFWNSYFIVSSIFKCFIPAKAFQTNTKYCSIIPEPKRPEDPWLEVTIQIPVYKESLLEVLMPTLKSCIASRDHYIQNTRTRVNIVICDDGKL